MPAGDLPRVLLLHNRYRSDGGEERSVAATAELLRARGHEVVVLERRSGEAGRVAAAAGMLGGGLHPEAVTRAVREFGADVVHAHNIHPLWGPRALAAAREAGARVVVTLHNFRFACSIGIAYRDGAPCFRCRGRVTFPGLRLRCRGSLPEAAVYTAGLAWHQPDLVSAVDRFLTVSGATASRLVEMGVPSSRLSVLPNFSFGFAPSSAAADGDYALVAGRLVQEKGLDVAVAAASAAGVPLVVAGAGPDLERLRGLAGPGVRFVGHLPGSELASLRAGAGAFLAPSRWEEPCPFAVIEAMADGVPVLASTLGGLPELVGEGSTVPPDDVPAWVAALRELWADRRARGEATLTRAREHLSADTHYAGLLAAYEGRDGD